MALDTKETTVRTDPEPAVQTTSRDIGHTRPRLSSRLVAALGVALLLLVLVLVRDNANATIAPSDRATTSERRTEPVPSGSPFDGPQEPGSDQTRSVPSGSPFDAPHTQTTDR